MAQMQRLVLQRSDADVEPGKTSLVLKVDPLGRIDRARILQVDDGVFLVGDLDPKPRRTRLLPVGRDRGEHPQEDCQPADVR